MGLWRLLLALGVVTEHAGQSYFIGSYTAVQLFFMISGFYMALILLSSRYGNNTKFYASRLARLFPVYWASILCGLGFAFWISGSFDTPTTITNLANVLPSLYGSDPVLFAWAVLANLFLLTADFSWFLQNVSVVGHPTSLLVQPPAWTLALELYFYALCPWLIRVRTAFLLVFIALSLIGRVVMYQYGFDNNPYHARFFPFELLFFVSGILTFRLYARRKNILTVFLRGRGGIAYSLAYLAATVFFYDLVKLFPAPALYGGFGDYLHSMAMCLLAIPAIVALFSHTRTIPLDRALGELSYPIYVVHYGFVSTLLHTKLTLPSHLSTFWTTLTLTIFTALMLHFFIQRPVDRWRERSFVSHRSQIGVPCG